MAMPPLTEYAALLSSEGDPEPLRNGVDRPVGSEENAWWGGVGATVGYEWPKTVRLESLRIVCDSDLNAHIRMNAWRPPIKRLPPTMVRDLTIEVKNDAVWRPVRTIHDNERRLMVIPLDESGDGVRMRIDRTWGKDRIRLFGLTVYGQET